MNLGFGVGGCGWFSSTGTYPTTTGRYSPVTGLYNPPAASPILVSGKGSRYAGLNAYVQAYEGAWYGALRRMLAEAVDLGASGVIGVRMEQTYIDNQAWEFSALGTAVRSTNPALVPTNKSDQPWSTDLSAEDTASAIFSGFVPREQVLAMSVTTKHPDWQLRNERGGWDNVEVTGLTELIRVARNASRTRLKERATGGAGAQLAVTDMSLRQFETVCSGSELDLHAESVITGTVLVPAPRFRRADSATVTSVISLKDTFSFTGPGANERQ